MFESPTRIVQCESNNLIELARASGYDNPSFFVGADLRGADLRGLDFSGYYFRGVDTKRAIVDHNTILPLEVSNKQLRYDITENFLENLGPVVKDIYARNETHGGVFMYIIACISHVYPSDFLKFVKGVYGYDSNGTVTIPENYDMIKNELMPMIGKRKNIHFSYVTHTESLEHQDRILLEMYVFGTIFETTLRHNNFSEELDNKTHGTFIGEAASGDLHEQSVRVIRNFRNLHTLFRSGKYKFSSERPTTSDIYQPFLPNFPGGKFSLSPGRHKRFWRDFRNLYERNPMMVHEAVSFSALTCYIDFQNIESRLYEYFGLSLEQIPLLDIRPKDDHT